MTTPPTPTPNAPRPYDDNTRWQSSDLWRIKDGVVETNKYGGWQPSSYTVEGLMDAERDGIFVRVPPTPTINAELLAAREKFLARVANAPSSATFSKEARAIVMDSVDDIQAASAARRAGGGE